MTNFGTVLFGKIVMRRRRMERFNRRGRCVLFPSCSGDRCVIITAVALLLLMSLAACTANPNRERILQPEQPNILMILVDDLGYTDLGSFGGNVQTPNIDALAAGGTRFSDAHVYPSCGPTRAGFITGMDPHRVGLGSQNNVGPPGVSTDTPGYSGSLEGNITSVAMILKNVGYRTYQSGKWHLGHQPKQLPAALGFDRNFTLLDGAASHYDMKAVSPSITPGGYVAYEENGHKVNELPTNFYTTKVFTEKMIDMISEGNTLSPQTPFFGYLAYSAVHDPLHAPEDLIMKYADLFIEGYEKLKDKRIAGLVRQGLISDASLASRWLTGTVKWDSLSQREQKDISRRMAVYAAMLEYLDKEVGILVEHLKSIGQYDNTLIIIMSDNGAATIPRTFYTKNVLDVQWQNENYPRRLIKNYGESGSFPVIGPQNAQAVSGPYFGFKTNLYEGGVRVPMIVKAPYQSQGRIDRQFVHIVDLLPTFADYARSDITHLTGVIGCSIKSVFESPDGRRCNQEFGMGYMGWRSYREGKWKLIFVSKSFGGTGNYALYDLSEDPGEVRDLSSIYPERVLEMADKWRNYAQEQGIVEVPMERVNGAFDAVSSRFFSIDWGD